jgi:hypothetical protein
MPLALDVLHEGGWLVRLPSDEITFSHQKAVVSLANLIKREISDDLRRRGGR